MPRFDPNWCVVPGLPKPSPDCRLYWVNSKFKCLNLTHREMDEVLARAARRWEDLPKLDPAYVARVCSFQDTPHPAAAPAPPKVERKTTNWREED